MKAQLESSNVLAAMQKNATFQGALEKKGVVPHHFDVSSFSTNDDLVLPVKLPFLSGEAGESASCFWSQLLAPDPKQRLLPSLRKRISQILPLINRD